MSELNINKIDGNGHVVGNNNSVKNTFVIGQENRHKKNNISADRKNEYKMSEIPKAFISYAWEDETNDWVKELATKLRTDGIDVKVDRWQLAPGDQLTHFMEQAVRENDYVLIICTPKYKLKSDNREGGVGYEGDIMTAEVFARGNHRKFIPIFKSGTKETSIPTWLAGKYYIDLSNERNTFKAGYQDILTTLHNARETAPPLGKKPHNLSSQHKEEPVIEEEIKIKGILVDEVTKPKGDGTRGSALYAIPFELNQTPPFEWNDLFIRSWNNPPVFTTMHRPGIARVSGNKITLDGTTIDEVAKYHRDTLMLAVEEANKKYKQLTEIRNKQEALQRKKDEEHKKMIKDIGDQIKF